jgi:hypothetical protein
VTDVTDLAAIRAALAAATPGPWDIEDETFGHSDAWIGQMYVGMEGVNRTQAARDAELIVLLRNNAEALLDELTTARILVQYADDYENGELSDNGWKDWHAAALRQSRIPKHDQHIPGPWPSNCVICSGDTSET